MDQSARSSVILSYQTHAFHKVLSRIAFWIGIAAVAIVAFFAVLTISLGAFQRVEFYIYADLFLGGFLIVISILYRKIIEWISNRGELLMEYDQIKVMHRNGNKEEVTELIAYTGKLRPLLMLRAVTASGNKVSFRISLIPGNRLHVPLNELSELARNAGIRYSEKRYTILSRWT